MPAGGGWANPTYRPGGRHCRTLVPLGTPLSVGAKPVQMQNRHCLRDPNLSGPGAEDNLALKYCEKCRGDAETHHLTPTHATTNSQQIWHGSDATRRDQQTVQTRFRLINVPAYRGSITFGIEQGPARRK